jgi:hypothetical protein
MKWACRTRPVLAAPAGCVAATNDFFMGVMKIQQGYDKNALRFWRRRVGRVKLLKVTVTPLHLLSKNPRN